MQGEWLHDTDRDQEVPTGQDLRAALKGEGLSAKQQHLCLPNPTSLTQSATRCLTSGLWTLPSWKEQSRGWLVHTWRYLHQWQG